MQEPRRSSQGRRASRGDGNGLHRRAPAASARAIPDDLESAFYAYLGFPEDDNRLCQTPYADMFEGCEVVLDLASGRGEFLDLLRDRGIRGIGVDSDTGMIRQVRDRGHEVVEDDALAYLRRDEPIVDGIYCAHFVEHLAPPDVLHLLAGAARRLRPGGRLIVATPNAACLHTQLVEFWRDLTHVRPYTLDLLRFLFTYTGFEVVEADVNPLRLLPRVRIPAPAPEAREAAMAAEDAARARISTPVPPGPPVPPPAPWEPQGRAAARRARDRLTGAAAVAGELEEMRRAMNDLQRRCTALEARLGAVDHDALRVAAAVRNLQDIVGETGRQVDGMFPPPEIYVLGVRTEVAGPT